MHRPQRCCWAGLGPAPGITHPLRPQRPGARKSAWTNAFDLSESEDALSRLRRKAQKGSVRVAFASLLLLTISARRTWDQKATLFKILLKIEEIFKKFSLKLSHE